MSDPAGEAIPLLEILRRTEAFFRRQGVPTPRFDAELLLAHVLKLPRLNLYLSFDRPMTPDELDALRPLVRRRGEREPLAWILGSRGFHGIDLQVRPGVLVPRPDTEALVEAALEWIGLPDGPVYVADVGCGSGAVGLAIAAACPQVRLYATDLSDEAISTTRANVAALSLGDRVAVLRGPWLDPIPANRPLDWVVSNPPYIRASEIAGLAPEVSRWEPKLALDGGRDGLDAYHALIPSARKRVRNGLLVEVGHDQADPVSRLFTQHGFHEVRTWPDLEGHRRVVGGRVPRPP